MGSKSKYVPTVTRQQAMRFAEVCGSAASIEEVLAEAVKLERRLKGSTKKGTWKYYLRRFVAGFRSGKLPHSIFADKGNVKLPFCSFSTLPIITCPGAGDCAEWCYSLTAWRYPAAFLRQCQNTLLLRFNKRAIIEAFKRIGKGRWFRLYVDGDFDSVETAVFWFRLLAQRPDIRAYGYSKSWEILRQVSHLVPDNYCLNLSSGSKYADDGELAKHMESLPWVRGWFIATPLTGKHAKGFARFDSKAYHDDVRQSAEAAGIDKVFSCGGKCGECSNAGPVCGLVEIKIPVAIGTH